MAELVSLAGEACLVDLKGLVGLDVTVEFESNIAALHRATKMRACALNDKLEINMFHIRSNTNFAQS